MVYVTMTDKRMSGWGDAKNRISKIVYEMPGNAEHLDTVLSNAENNSDMSYVNVCEKKPYYAPGKYHVSYRSIETHPAMYV